MSQEQRLDRVSAPTLWELRPEIAAPLSSVQRPGAKEALCEHQGTCGTPPQMMGARGLLRTKVGVVGFAHTVGVLTITPAILLSLPMRLTRVWYTPGRQASAPLL